MDVGLRVRRDQGVWGGIRPTGVSKGGDAERMAFINLCRKKRIYLGVASQPDPVSIEARETERAKVARMPR